MAKLCFLLVAFILLQMIPLSVSLRIMCKKHEREALLKFKHSFTRDSQSLLSSWVGYECCHWLGVSCDNVTRDVTKLNLGYLPTSLVSFELSSALLELKSLNHLDLSFNNFTESRIPAFLGSMTKLRYLNLSSGVFSGPFPPQLGNLTNLIQLDLSDFREYTPDTQESLKWASGLSKLQYLSLGGVNMSQTYDTLQVLFRLPSLLVLSLYQCSLQNTHLSYIRITNTSTSNLQRLDLDSNNFEGPFPSFLKSMPSLQSLTLVSNKFNGTVPIWLSNLRRFDYLDLSYNNFNDTVPTWLSNLSRLDYLDLSYNNFHGQIPASLAKLSALKHLDLSNNRMSGVLPPSSLWYLTELVHLDISYNAIQGIVSRIGNLSKLSYLNMNSNNIKLNLSTNWQPPFQLQVLGASSCEINTAFPQWLMNQTQITSLDLSDTGITGELPQWLWNFTHLDRLQLADNKLTGSLPSHINCDGCNLSWIDLQNNMFSGTIPNWLKHQNRLGVGTIPNWLKHQNRLGVLDLSRNFLSGRIFEEENASSLLSGESPLILLDLSENMLSGEIKITNAYRGGGALQLLSLRGNDFIGFISSQLCHFTELYILELAHNRLTGHIPHCLGSLIFDRDDYGFVSNSGVKIQEIIKGTNENLTGTLSAHSMIDLSCNHLVGTIPEELTNITNLMQLNLSNNHLTGGIPNDIGNLQYLESLDLSNNNLSGTIPQSLSSVPWLSVLNLSYNHLHGSIPMGRQLQTLDDPTIYVGNSGLCGFPLKEKCTQDSPPSSMTANNNHSDDKGNKRENIWFYLVIMSGVATGFWGVVGTLLAKKSWRYAYFRFVEETPNKIYVKFKMGMHIFRRTNS